MQVSICYNYTMIYTVPELILLCLFIFFFGAGLGSFACCQARRLHEKHNSPRSLCEHCKAQLKWYENIPIFSWLFQRGKCNHCKKPIGKAELVSELLVGLAFTGLGFYLLSSSLEFNLLTILSCLLVTIILIIASILAIYDALYHEFPTFLLWILVALCAIPAAYNLYNSNFSLGLLKSLGFATLILPGLYLFLYTISKEKLVGAGDWILCLAIILLLLQWEAAFLTLFLSNLLASLYGLPLLLKKSKNKTVPFGPFLVIGAYLAFFLAPYFILLCNI